MKTFVQAGNYWLLKEHENPEWKLGRDSKTGKPRVIEPELQDIEVEITGLDEAAIRQLQEKTEDLILQAFKDINCVYLAHYGWERTDLSFDGKAKALSNTIAIFELDEHGKDREIDWYSEYEEKTEP
jgi:hypothetical protein